MREEVLLRQGRFNEEGIPVSRRENFLNFPKNSKRQETQTEPSS